MGALRPVASRVGFYQPSLCTKVFDWIKDLILRILCISNQRFERKLEYVPTPFIGRRAEGTKNTIDKFTDQLKELALQVSLSSKTHEILGFSCAKQSCHINAALQLIYAVLKKQKLLDGILKTSLCWDESHTLQEFSEGSLKTLLSDVKDSKLILYKWSLLLLLKAKLVGNQNLFKSASEIHVELCSELDLHSDLKGELGNQNDIMHYLQVALPILGYSFTTEFEGLKELHKLWITHVPLAESIAFEELLKKSLQNEVKGQYKISGNTPPEFLFVQATRFQPLQTDGLFFCRKVMRPIEFPQDLKVDLSSLFKETVSANYKVIAFSSHEGIDISKGHYTTAYEENNVWIDCNGKHLELLGNPQEKLSQASIIVLKRSKGPN